MTRTSLTRCDQQVAKYTIMTSGKGSQFIEVDYLPFKGPNNLIFAVKMCITKSARNLSNAKQPLNSPKQPHGKYRDNNYDISGSKIEFLCFKEYSCQMKSKKPKYETRDVDKDSPGIILIQLSNPSRCLDNSNQHYTQYKIGYGSSDKSLRYGHGYIYQSAK